MLKDSFTKIFCSRNTLLQHLYKTCFFSHIYLNSNKRYGKIYTIPDLQKNNLELFSNIGTEDDMMKLQANRIQLLILRRMSAVIFILNFI